MLFMCQFLCSVHHDVMYIIMLYNIQATVSKPTQQGENWTVPTCHDYNKSSPVSISFSSFSYFNVCISEHVIVLPN